MIHRPAHVIPLLVASFAMAAVGCRSRPANSTAAEGIPTRPPDLAPPMRQQPAGPPPDALPVTHARYGFAQPAFGVEFRVLLYAADEAAAKSAAAAAFDRVEELERKLSPNQPDSDVARMVAAASRLVWNTEASAKRERSSMTWKRAA